MTNFKTTLIATAVGAIAVLSIHTAADAAPSGKSSIAQHAQSRSLSVVAPGYTIPAPATTLVRQDRGWNRFFHRTARPGAASAQAMTTATVR